MSTLINKDINIPVQLETEFQTLLGKTFAAEPAWLKEKRKTAFEEFSKKGIPGRKSETYKYSDLKKIFAGKFTAVHNEQHKLDIDISKISVSKDSIKLEFVNGWLYKESSLSAELPKGVVVGSMAADALFLQQNILEKNIARTASIEKDALIALNTALWCDGAFIYVPDNTELPKPIEIIHICTGSAELLVNPRHLVVAGKNSRAQVIEHSVSLDTKKTVIVNSVAEVIVGANAHVNYYKVQDSNKNLVHLHGTYASQDERSVFDTCTFTLGSEWVRNNLSIALNGEFCESHLNGLFVTNGSEHVDNHTQVWHNMPNCQSNQLYKGVLDGKSTGVFNGMIYVARDAQKTNAYQSSKNILMSDDATINTKPQLEIYADDVKCSHGSTTGALNEDALFYLRARGLGEESARALLLLAFANDVLETIRIEELKEYLKGLVERRLNRELSR